MSEINEENVEVTGEPKDITPEESVSTGEPAATTPEGSVPGGLVEPTPEVVPEVPTVSLEEGVSPEVPAGSMSNF